MGKVQSLERYTWRTKYQWLRSTPHPVTVDPPPPHQTGGFDDFGNETGVSTEIPAAGYLRLPATEYLSWRSLANLAYAAKRIGECHLSSASNIAQDPKEYTDQNRSRSIDKSAVDSLFSMVAERDEACRTSGGPGINAEDSDIVQRLAVRFQIDESAPDVVGEDTLGCPRKLGSMVSKWVITPIHPIYMWGYITHLLTIDPNFQRDIQAGTTT